jgi:probable rRNA maturation factor
MTYKIFIHVDPAYQPKVQKLRKFAHATLTYLDAPPGDLTLVFADDETIQELNRRFAGKDRPTDVLSFPGESSDIKTGRSYYGDVVISLPYAEHQAQEAGHSLQDELTLLIIHGVLHLLGFDHSSPEEHRNMWSIQDEILSQLGCEIGSPR